jgi:glycosyltransferase involved in cell wall biosynthesis
MMTISVVIPTFHRYDPLKDTVNDLLRQSVAPQQIIVVDNTTYSERSRPECLDSSGETECLYISSRCEGKVNVARNEGLRAVTSDYVLLLDDDMSLPPDCLEGFLRAHEEGWDAVTGVMFEQSVLLESTVGNTRRPLWEVLRAKHGPTRGNTIAVPEGFVSLRLSMLKELNYLDETYIYNYDDYDLGYRMWRGGFAVIHDDRITAHHLKLPIGGSRQDLVGRKRSLNKYTAKYYFLSKHFGESAVKVELVTDIIFAVADGKLRIHRAASELLILLKAWKGHVRHGVEQDASLEAPTLKYENSVSID